MKKLHLLFVLCFMATTVLWSQESYTVLKVSAENAPDIDGEIEDIWNEVVLVSLEKDVDDGSRTIEKDPEDSDYKVEFGLLWNDDGLFILTIIEDDIFVNDNGKEWWKDDDINFLIPPDLTSTGTTPFEFAWMVMSEEEGKAVPYQNVSIDAVSAAWENSGTTYNFEAFISWEAFTGTVADNAEILFEARARDDDKDGDAIYPQSFLQWSTDLKSVETNGIGAGTLLLSSDEVTNETAISSIRNENDVVRIYPNPTVNNLNIEFQESLNGGIYGRIIDVSGKLVMSFEDLTPQNKDIKTIDVSALKAGIYCIEIKNLNFNSQQLLHIIK